jgi:eukaryotic translation initiation factor 2C
LKLQRPETRIEVDLDAEEGRTNSNGKNKHVLFVKFTRKVDISHLNAFLDGSTSWSTECIDTVNFLDHVLRELPSQKYTQIKKSFFQRGEQRFDLGGGVEAFKGVFSSLRPVLDGQHKKSLSINVDVANGTFWRSQELIKAVLAAFGFSAPQLQQRFKDAKSDATWKKSYLRKDLARFKRVGVTATHNPKAPTQWTIEQFVNKDCHEAQVPDPDDHNPVENLRRKVSLYDYYKKKYGVTLMPGVPVVQMTKKIRKNPVYIPLEHLHIDANQRYNTKLSEQQTSQMIKFAVTLPAERRKAVEAGVKLLDWANDPYLKHYGIKVNPAPTKVKARILPPPALTFSPPGAANSKIQERDLVQGRWRLDGKKFIQPNLREIGAWGFVVIAGRGAPSKEQTMAFVDKFIKVYEGHGGKFSPKWAKRPFLAQGNLADGGEMVAKVYNQTGNHFGARPMFMVFVVNDRNADVYRRIKKSCDCRFGIASQVMQSKHVHTAQPQYISNVCMKVNAKLGGATAWAQSVLIPKINPKAAGTSTMVIGADVSHPAPGAGSDEKASFAAITMSSDTTYTRYWAQCQTNGNRVEMVTTQNINENMGDMARMWLQKVGKGLPPKRVLYIRDGVSEGQYAAVLEEEVRDMRAVFSMIGCKEIPKFTVVIAGKRHHIRFFPEQGHGDRNGNPIPGTLVETGCTHPFEFDFYLCAHSAIKGTARPIHYQCILNDGNWQAAELQSFIFEHSFQYVRSTTPVSLHPAVYYAHLAADRSRAHVNENPVSSGKKEAKAEQKSTVDSSQAATVVSPLIPMGATMGLKEVMWYV